MSVRYFITDDYARFLATLVLLCLNAVLVVWFLTRDLRDRRDRERVLVSVFGRGDRIKKNL